VSADAHASYFRCPIVVPLSSLYLDPNNLRIAPEEPPGYDIPEHAFQPELQKELERSVARVYHVELLERAILTQGWMPIDNIVVWRHPSEPDRFIVVEGNTRTVALRRLHERLVGEQAELRRLRTTNERRPDVCGSNANWLND
jgi:hypothetical protein